MKKSFIIFYINRIICQSYFFHPKENYYSFIIFQVNRIYLTCIFMQQSHLFRYSPIIYIICEFIRAQEPRIPSATWRGESSPRSTVSLYTSTISRDTIPTSSSRPRRNAMEGSGWCPPPRKST